MSRAQDPRKPIFSFGGNPFQTLKSKGSYLSPKLIDLLNSFEVTLKERLINLKPNNNEEILNLSWMKRGMESLSATYTDIQGLITVLELPVCDWDEKWMDIYLDNSIKLLDICLAFSSEISRLGQAHLYLQSFLHNIDEGHELVHAQSLLDKWRQHIESKNPKMENCFILLSSLVGTLDLPKIKNSAKGKVLMRAMYGLKVATVFVCNIFAIAFSGSSSSIKFLNLPISETFLWSEPFTDLQAFVNSEIRNTYSNGTFTGLKEVDAVDNSVKDLRLIVDAESQAFKNSVASFKSNAVKLSQGLDHLAKVEDGFFHIVLTGRDALLCSLRVHGQ